MGFFEPSSTALAEPPWLPEEGLSASHCGSGAARHRPDVSAAAPERKTGAHAAVSQPAYLPWLRPWYHSSLKSGSTETRSFWIMSCQ
jgi:hypothetical protein